MKIALVINELNIKGGTHKQLINLALYLSSKNHSVRIYTSEYSAELYPTNSNNLKVISYGSKYEGIEVYQYLKKTSSRLKMAKDINSWADVVNIHDNGLLVSNLYIKFFNPSKKVIWQINDFPPCFKVGTSKKEVERWNCFIVRRLNRWVAKKNDLITVNVTKNKERVKQILNKNAEVVYCGVDIKESNFKEKQIDVKKPIILLSIGVFMPYRNYETLIKVHQDLQEKYNLQVETVIVGSTKLDPDYAKKVEGLIAVSGLNIKILGQVSDQLLENLYSRAHFFIFLNVDQSWGLAVFEAMNHSLPVIVSNSVGAVELLSDNQTACIVDPFDTITISKKIISLINDKSYYNGLALNGYNHTKSMTWDKMYSSKIEKIIFTLTSQ